ncbi:MAG: nitrogen fixation/metabolism regulation signal transduction histidine kinase [Myxococcota bacterium]|jgi:nitrogen fixation/metabolism regulation signal transduction histidine kinase
MKLERPDDLALIQVTPTRLLLVDDEPFALEMIAEALVDGLEDAGWRRLTVETAASGEEALEVAGTTNLDLLVTDVVMPGIDGIETFARLKEINPQLSCVVMTGIAPQHSTPIRAMRLGASDYVNKPVDAEYLIQTCHRLLMVHHLRRAVDDGRTLMESVVESVDAGVVALRDGEVLLSNSAARKLLGQGEIVQRMEELGIAEALPGPDGLRVRQLPEVHLQVEGGPPRSVAVTGSPVVTRNGERLGDVVVMRDVTHMVQAKSMDSFKRMAAIAAHEMKNSVTGLGLVTEHLVARLEQGRLEVEETGRMARIILDSVARLDRFARSFLGFSRIPDPRPVRTPANALIDEALELYGREKGLPDWVSVERNLADGLPDVETDRDLMFQVLQNLILNAVEAMESAGEGRLALSSGMEGDRIRLTVADSGVGIADHMLERIWEPNVTTREAGSGLGLVVVRDIVAKHGGEVRVRSVAGEGASFDVLLPAAED